MRSWRWMGLAAFAAGALLSLGWAPRATAAAQFTPPYPVDVYVRGTFNEWGLADPMKFDASHNRYIVRMRLEAGTYEFKIASEDWATVDLGYAEDPWITLGTPKHIMSVSYQNLVVQIERTGLYQFTLDPSDPNDVTLNLRALAQGNIPPDHRPDVYRQVHAYASGNVCYDGPNGEYRCRDFTVSDTTLTVQKVRETRLSYTFYRSGPNLFGYRYLDCPVDPSSINVTPNRVVWDAKADPTSGGCYAYGYLIVDGEYQDWSWDGAVEVKGEMSDPGFQQSSDSLQTYRDNVAGSWSRHQCRSGYGTSIGAGGVYFSTTAGNLLYFPFDSFGQYGQASGSYGYETCSTLQH